MPHGPEFTVVLIAVLSLLLGAATRGVSRRTSIPYTIAMLVLGLGTGIALRHVHGTEGLAGLLHVLSQAASLSPHLIIFVFLPALVFESAFALDVYGFRRNLGPIVLLAGPALVVCTVLTAAAMVGLTRGSWSWSWPAALVFGALISATDPVAVVALLRELGAPKRLGILIEGESLLNDGTAIVVFNVLLAVLVGTAAGAFSVSGATLDFFRVVLGGMAVGLALALIATFWLSHTFNDALVEITLTIVLAYSAMLVAEGILHVSGVMAIVTAGLWMSGQGRTRISPEVGHFLHRFWEMLSYIANTLIFYLVGLVIAVQVAAPRWSDVLVVLGAYVAVMAIRFLVVFASLPAMNRLGDRISPAQATVMGWGGLRGAVSLALGLVISQHAGLAPLLREQILLATAGVVVLTIVINGAAMAPLLRRFGFHKPPLGEQLALCSAQGWVLERVEAQLDEVARARDLRTVSWKEVHDDLHARQEKVQAQLDDLNQKLAQSPARDRAIGYWQQVLNIERQAYWSAFSHGTLAAKTVRALNRELDVQIDRMGHGELTPPASRLPEGAGERSAMSSILSRVGLGGLEFEHLSLVHDLSRAETMGASKVIASLGSLKGADPVVVEHIRATYQGYLRVGKERLEDLRTNLPEVTQAIETRLARRIQLNFERDGYEHLVHDGALGDLEVSPSLAHVEAEMKRLLHAATELKLPETAELCRHTPLFADLDDATIDELAKLTIEEALSPGQVLFKEGDKGDSMFIIARGAAHVLKHTDGQDVLLDVLGGGDILGEMALLTGEPRTATIRAATTVTVGRIARDAFTRLMAAQPHLSDRIWDAFARREFDNYLRAHPDFGHLSREARLGWIAASTQLALDEDETATGNGAAYAFVILGQVETASGTCKAPRLVPLTNGETVRATTHARLAWLPPMRPEP